MFTAIALVLVAFLNAGFAPDPLFEDAPVVAVMGDLAISALHETHPECVVEGDPTWDFNRDSSAGLSVIGRIADCEAAGWFYRSPETGLWQFTVEGS